MEGTHQGNEVAELILNIFVLSILALRQEARLAFQESSTFGKANNLFISNTPIMKAYGDSASSHFYLGEQNDGLNGFLLNTPYDKLACSFMI